MRRFDPVVELQSVGNRRWRRSVCRIVKLRPVGGDAICYDDSDEEEDVEWDEEGLADYDCSEVVSHVTLDVFFEGLYAAGFRPKQNEQNPGHYSAICPAHNGCHRNLLFREGPDGYVEFKCLRGDGCTKGEILGVLAPYILAVQEKTTPPEPIRDLSLPEPKSDWGKLEAGYVYKDEEGKSLFRVDRRRLSDGDKTFIQYHSKFDADGEFDRWVLGVPASVRRVPFRLPQVLAAVRAGWAIIIVEGEKDVLNLERLGIVATTCPGGTGRGWSAEYNKHFAGAHVVILPDNDDAGRRHAQNVAQHLSPIAASVQVVELPGLPVKGDASDWIAAGGTLEQLLALVGEASGPGPTAQVSTGAGRFGWLMVSNDTNELRTVDKGGWIIRQVYREKRTGCLWGPTNVGKTIVVLDQVMAIVGGLPDWCGRAIEVSGPVCWVAGEGIENLADLIDGYKLHHPEYRQVHPLYVLPNSINFRDQHTIDELIADLQNRETVPVPPIMIVIETLSQNFGGGNENGQQDMQQFVNAGMARIVRATKALVLCVHHTGIDPDRERGSRVLRSDVEIMWAVLEAGEMRATFAPVKLKGRAADPVNFNITQHVGKRTNEEGEQEEFEYAIIIQDHTVKAGDVVSRDGLRGAGPAGLDWTLTGWARKILEVLGVGGLMKRVELCKALDIDSRKEPAPFKRTMNLLQGKKDGKQEDVIDPLAIYINRLGSGHETFWELSARGAAKLEELNGPGVAPAQEPSPDEGAEE